MKIWRSSVRNWLRAEFHLKNTFFIVMLLIFTTACSKDNKVNIIDISGDDTEETEDPVDDYTATPFDGVPNIEDIVMYEANELVFASTNSFEVITEKLDDLQSLGINTLWLMPIYPLGETNAVGSPYCIKDLEDINPNYGDLESIRNLVDAAHEKGMAVILDWVANHTSWDHPWIESHKSWYVLDDAGNIIIPPDTDWEDVAELNYDNSDMCDAMIESMKYWILNANIDGFRCDAADMVPYEFWKSAITELRSLPDRDLIFLAEGERSDHFDAGFDMNYGWQYYTAIKNVIRDGYSTSALQTAHVNEYSNVPEGSRILRFTTNHDESAWDGTPVQLLGSQDAALCGYALAMASGGVPLVYSTQEVGVSGTVSFFNSSTIRWEQNPEVREGYSKLLKIFNNNTLLHDNNPTFMGSDDVSIIKHTNGEESIYVITNVRNNSVEYTLPEELQGADVNELISGETQTLGTSLQLDAYAYVIIKTN